MLSRLRNKRRGILLKIKKKINHLKYHSDDDVPLLNSKFPWNYILHYISNKPDKAVSHISAFTYGNMGDALLPVVMRDFLESKIEIHKWHGVDVHEAVTSKVTKELNKSKFTLIGGGGLFLRDTFPNEVSGWQWNCSVEQMQKIKSPIVAYAIGYNRFRGQQEFNPIFTKHIRAFVHQAAFVGLRNHGSIEALKHYLDDETLRQKLCFQPCLTTLLSYVYPKLTDYQQKENFIALNCAFDRLEMRQQGRDFLTSMARVIKRLSLIAPIKYYSHMPSDLKMLDYLDRYLVPYQVVEMNGVRQMIEEYARPRLVMGMRGHAQMIPFGCQTPILSIISHNKMQWFLDDIGHPDWGVDVVEDEFERKLYSKAIDSYHNYESRICDVMKAQERFWNITLKNLNVIIKLIR